MLRGIDRPTGLCHILNSVYSNPTAHRDILFEMCAGEYSVNVSSDVTQEFLTEVAQLPKLLFAPSFTGNYPRDNTEGKVTAMYKKCD